MMQIMSRIVRIVKRCRIAISCVCSWWIRRQNRRCRCIHIIVVRSRWRWRRSIWSIAASAITICASRTISRRSWVRIMTLWARFVLVMPMQMTRVIIIIKAWLIRWMIVRSVMVTIQLTINRSSNRCTIRICIVARSIINRWIRWVKRLTWMISKVVWGFT